MNTIREITGINILPVERTTSTLYTGVYNWPSSQEYPDLFCTVELPLTATEKQCYEALRVLLCKHYRLPANSTVRVINGVSGKVSIEMAPTAN